MSIVEADKIFARTVINRRSQDGSKSVTSFNLNNRTKYSPAAAIYDGLLASTEALGRVPPADNVGTAGSSIPDSASFRLMKRLNRRSSRRFDCNNRIRVTRFQKLPPRQRTNVKVLTTVDPLELIAESEQISPIILRPGFWSLREEAKVPSLLELYRTGKVTTPGEYSTIEKALTYPERRRAWLGKPLPQQRFLTRKGRVLNLETFHNDGKKVLVVILRGFAGQVCLYCSAQTRILSEMQEQFAAANTEIVFVYPGPASSIGPFLQAVKSVGGDEEKLPHIALDTNLKLVSALDIGKELAKPTSILIDPDGNVAYTYVGADMVDRPSGEFLLQQTQKLSR